jgi:hypothetical protein
VNSWAAVVTDGRLTARDRDLLHRSAAAHGRFVVRPQVLLASEKFRAATRDRAHLVALAAAYDVPELENTAELQKAVAAAMAREGDGP